MLVAAHFLFRYVYYGEWLPNTYYAKHVRPWYESGFRYLWAAALETGLYILLPMAFLALRLRWRINRDGTYALALLCVAAHMAYLLPIGGDHFEYRPLDYYWPLLAVPAAEGIALLGSRVAAGLQRVPRRPGWVTRGEIYTIALFLPVLFYANAIQGILLVKGTAIREHTSMLYAELNKENAGWLLAAPGMPMLVAISNDLRRQSAYAVARRFNDQSGVADWHIRDWSRYETIACEIIPDDALTVDGGLGKFYFLPDLKVIDFHGLTDATVARTPVKHANVHRLMVARPQGDRPNTLRQRGVIFKIYRAACRGARTRGLSCQGRPRSVDAV